jgi:hypothetical protein
MSAMQAERVEKLEALLTRIRSRTRAPHPKWAILAKDVEHVGLLPTPAPVPVSDVAPTIPDGRAERVRYGTTERSGENPRVLAATPMPSSDDEVTTDPLPEKKLLPERIVAQKLTSTAVLTPRPIDIVPAPPPAKPIPRAKTLLMGAAPVAKSPSSFPPPAPAPPPVPDFASASPSPPSLHEAPTARRRVDPRLVESTPTPPPEPTPPIETPPIAEEAPIAQHRIVRIASPAPPPPPEHAAAPSPSAPSPPPGPAAAPAPAPAVASAPTPARAPVHAPALRRNPASAPPLHDDLPPLPPVIPIPVSAAPISRTPEKPASKGWWLAIVVFVVFATLLFLALHYNLLSTRT